MRIIVALIVFVALSFSAHAQKFSNLDTSPLDAAYYPDRVAARQFAKTEEEKNAVPVIRVLYSRPQKKDREIFGELIPYGKLWRIGANESTEILFMKDVKVGGTKVKAGRYTLHAMLGEKEWEIFVNKDVDRWGSYSYDEKLNVASVKVPVEKAEESIEALSIVFEPADDGAHMVIGWDDTMVRVPIQF